MKESYRKGVANHPGPEPCEGSREAALEALDRGYAGWALSSENGNAGGRRCHPNRKATRRRAIGQVRRGPAESKTPRMYRSSTRENREAQSPPMIERSWAGGGKR
jgi:hypothetical protein